MKKFLFLVFTIGVTLFSSCSLGSKKDDPGLLAASTAKGYYDLLLEGKYEEYVNGLYKPDTIPNEYRRQLVANAKMFVQQMKDEHKGMDNVRILDCKADTSMHVANVFLVLSFDDNTVEEIVVPMVEVKGKWWMR